MSDHYSEFVQNPLGRKIAQNLGLPMPISLERYKDEQAPVTGSVIFGVSENAVLANDIAKVLANVQADVYLDPNESARDALQNAQIDAEQFGANQYFKVAIFDASGINTTHELKQVYNFFHPIARSIDRSGRVIGYWLAT